MAVINAASLAAAKTGTNLPGSFNATHPASTPAPAKAAPAAAPKSAAAAPTASSGGGSSYDPAAAAAAQAAAQARSDYNNLNSTTFGSINDAIGQNAKTFNSGLLDYLDSEKSQQNTINQKAIQNELSKITGTNGVLAMVGHGIQSGGITLANDNATDSSAAEALARAYGDIGRRQLSGVGNQYEQGVSGIQSDQSNLDQANATELRHAQENKASVINSIVGDAVNKLTALNQAAAGAALPDRVDINAQKAAITSQAMGALSAYDQVLSSGFAANAPTSTDQNRASASQLSQAGTAPDNAFSYTTSVPAEFQGTGPFASQLPIFTAPGKSKTDTTTSP